MRSVSSVQKSSSKCANLDCENKNDKKKQKLSSADARKELAEEHERELKEKHGDKYTRFQYKLWAEMLASGVHTNVDEPPAASMFSRSSKRQRPNTNDDVFHGMISVMNTLCSAVSNRQVGNNNPPLQLVHHL